MEHNFDFNELIELATQHGIEISEEFEKRPKYLDVEKSVSHRIVFNMPNDEYHSHNGLSATSLKKAKTPLHYAQYLQEGFKVKDNRCLIIGTTMHALLLEKNKQHEFKVYDQEKLLDEAQGYKPETLRENLNKTKVWREMMANYKDENGQFYDNVVEKQQFTAIWNIQKKLRQHPELKNLYRDAKDEVSFFAEFKDISVRCRPDLIKIADETDAQNFDGINVGDIIIISVKTTIDASPYKFSKECKDRGYRMAEAFYQDIIRTVYQRDIHTFYLAIEKDDKHIMSGQAMLYRCSDSHIAIGRKEYETNLDVVLSYRQNPKTPQGYEFHNNGSMIMQLD